MFTLKFLTLKTLPVDVVNDRNVGTDFNRTSVLDTIRKMEEIILHANSDTGNFNIECHEQCWKHW